MGTEEALGTQAVVSPWRPRIGTLVGDFLGQEGAIEPPEALVFNVKGSGL